MLSCMRSVIGRMVVSMVTMVHLQECWAFTSCRRGERGEEGGERRRGEEEKRREEERKQVGSVGERGETPTVC